MEAGIKLLPRQVERLRVEAAGAQFERKRSLSTSDLPALDFLTVPSVIIPQRRRSHSLSNIKKVRSVEWLRRTANETSLTIPDNFSFRSVGQIKVLRRRWLLLVLCVLFTSVSHLQWIQYSIVANIIMKYYDVPAVSVDLTSLIFMVIYILFVFPVSYYMDVRGLRLTAIIGSGGTAIGSWIKVYSLEQNQFSVVLLGQTVVAICQVFVLAVPARLATEWFEAKEMSFVCSSGVFAVQLGVAAGFLLPPMIIKNHPDRSEIRSDMADFHLMVALISTVTAILTILFFQSKPKYPPNHVEALHRCVGASNKGYWNAIGRLLTENVDYRKLVLAYGINVGVFNAFSTLLNQMVLFYFPNSELDAGRIGLAVIVIGMLGSLAFGYLMDTMHKFKESALLVCLLASFTMVMFCFALESQSKAMLFTGTIMLGFFMTGFQPIGYEYGAEIAFPEPDNAVAGIMNIATHICGILFTLVVPELQRRCGTFVGNMSFATLLFFSTFLVSTITSKLKRFSAHSDMKIEAEQEHLECDKEFDFQGFILKIDSYD